MTQTAKADRPSKDPKPKYFQSLPDSLVVLAIELARFDPRERVPSHRQAIRNKAKAIIEERQRWPPELFPWKTMRERKGCDCPWLDERNLTPPQRERMRAEDRAWARRHKEKVGT